MGSNPTPTAILAGVQSAAERDPVLRRLVASARRQDWFAVAVELIVVVAGIFIGLQVANWNEGRKAARLEKLRPEAFGRTGSSGSEKTLHPLERGEQDLDFVIVGVSKIDPPVQGCDAQRVLEANGSTASVAIAELEQADAH